VKVALVGTGFWAQQLAAAAERAGLQVTACYNRDEERRRAFAKRVGCRPAASLEDALEGAEGAILATPNDTHAEQAIAAAARGVHVFVEKPIADTLEAGVRIRDACTAAGVRLAVGHCFRRLGAARRAKELVDADALGRVVLAEANFSLTGSFPEGAWRRYRERNRGGPLLQLGIHHVDTLAYLLGPVERTTGVLRRVATEAEIDDAGVATLEFSSGALGALTGSYVSPRTFSLRLLGTDAVLDYRADMSVWPQAERVDEATTLTLNGEPVVFERRDMLAEELAEWARGEEPETGAAEGLAALKVILDAVG
jgi:UDP-N-acetyl-2-amino-2-deoxyglucuronate dehydrogenase